jgi:hypothetical protein
MLVQACVLGSVGRRRKRLVTRFRYVFGCGSAAGGQMRETPGLNPVLGRISPAPSSVQIVIRSEQQKTCLSHTAYRR